MKKLLFTTLFLITATLSVAAPQAPGSGPVWIPMSNQGTAPLTNFTFDTDNMGWLQTYIGRPDGIGYDGLYPNSSAIWNGSNGNPPGSITQTATTDLDQRAYWLGYYGEPQFLGDLADAYLQCDIYSTGNWATIAKGNGGDDGHVYARWVISKTCPSDPALYDMFISLRAASVDLNSFTGWQTFSVDLHSTNFMRWPNGVCGSYAFDDVLKNYDQIGLYVFSGTDDVDDIANAAAWLTVNGVSRLQHYGAGAGALNRATWGVDNMTAGGNSVANEPASFGAVKALFR